ncbi:MULTISPECIES: UDP-N-acetylmuramoyl-tripeptide--D-alanyl-D-alanine ligase [unclassified Microcoleus]|uniref:UDP-N-acetylmuramoyl-tripeptide--D-alanyl-D- alanine ligase n=1 Tax=unclassified Microcoleus TaxID=2642155 RepID=UPI001D45646C|nr:MULTISPECIES: UDP-N-acetylmuramoyl-tripeptide--D-alanyl-D-alanine ligase [unclassified Microcoleus]MCC3503999.1 UDP-N-acetylmuramoyl-tripeptide--D-alanyl-D-alanine ligase [Microcoleus sp. PH2017_19_SFW_U_A]TAF96028.1 MAG: UDP-N-acetylmuramoyl-tripeptide--D-alanyl-D-alanine ligase [Oscillatoriales cyanobacterium]MCC3434416.1 UDP-N-acetylmuramoyl-tripeptide--D-alanyl-D-alanine ligase [Microcoleus sp. PH2017_05_CCC_O_A]MCC3521957.1 UDP-N-acetylmuramoyl-tripeptide--D-alanyl-D-alanine ligase [Mic
MVCRVSIAQLAEILTVPLLAVSEDVLTVVGTGIATDTRTIEGGEVFLALRGENFDGHQFVAKARDLGAIAAVVDRTYQAEVPNFPLLRVDDTLKAYQAIARWWRDQFSIPIIGVTGSVGKTTAKELIAAVLSTSGNVLKTQYNYNNEIGVPKTLLELSPTHNYAVIEMGMRGLGEIALLSQIARPTVAVITNVGTAHIGRLGSEDAIAQAKCELLAEMPAESIAILNHDSDRLMATAAQVWQGKTLSYGLEGGDLCGELLNNDTMLVEGVELPLPLAGRHNAVNYLAALAVAKVLGINWEVLQQGLSVQLPDGRARRYDLPQDVVILDETYNAGLESMLAALRLLADTPGKRRIAVLGTMKELGERAIEFHRQVGKAARDLNLDALFVFADFEEAAAMAAGAAGVPFVEIGDITAPDGREDLAKRLLGFVEKGDRILFKASHSVELNRVVQKFRADFAGQ